MNRNEQSLLTDSFEEEQMITVHPTNSECSLSKALVLKKYIGLLAEEEVFIRAQSDAQRAGVTVSDHLRGLIMGAPLPRKRRVSSVEKKNVAKFIGAINKVGGNLNQIAKVLNIANKLGDWGQLPKYDVLLDRIEETNRLIREIHRELLSTQKQNKS